MEKEKEIQGSGTNVNQPPIITPKPGERETAQMYFKYYMPAFGTKMKSTPAGRPNTRGYCTARVGDMVLYDEIADIRGTLHGPYMILDIRRVMIETRPYRIDETHVYLDRYDFLLPVKPTRIHLNSHIQKFIKDKLKTEGPTV